MAGEVLGGAGSLFVPVFYLWCKLRTNLFSSLQISATDHVNRVPGCSPCRGETSSGKGGGNYFKAFYCLCVLFQGCCLNCACVLKLVLTYRMEETSQRNCRWDKSGCFILVWVVFFFSHNTKLSLYDLLFHHPWIYSSLELVWWWHFFFSAYWKLWVVPVGQPHAHPSIWTYQCRAGNFTLSGAFQGGTERAFPFPLGASHLGGTTAALSWVRAKLQEVCSMLDVHSPQPFLWDCSVETSQPFPFFA